MEYVNKIKQILGATGWSQEALANRLGVSFVTLNSWVNDRSAPTRPEHLTNIDQIYGQILGFESVDSSALSNLKKQAERQRLSVRKLLDDRELLEEITVNLTYHTNTIEGSTMTKGDVEDVLLDNKVLSNRTAIEQREAVNHQTALLFLLDRLANDPDFAFTTDLIKATHLRLMNGIISDAGLYRNHAVRIVGSHVTLANFIKIPGLLLSLANQLNEETSDPINLLAQTHADFEQIHPFSDGNGRTGRLLMFIKSLQMGIFPPIVEKDKKAAYYKYLELAQSQGRFDLLEQFLAEAILAKG